MLLDLYLGHLADAFVQSHLQEVHLSEEREATIYIAVGTVGLIIEGTIGSARHLRLLG